MRPAAACAFADQKSPLPPVSVPQRPPVSPWDLNTSLDTIDLVSTLVFPDIGLKPTVLRAAVRRARKQGKSPSEYLRSLVERDVSTADSFDDVLKPFREAFAKSGKSEQDLDDAVARARKDIHRRNKRKVRR